MPYHNLARHPHGTVIPSGMSSSAIFSVPLGQKRKSFEENIQPVIQVHQTLFTAKYKDKWHLDSYASVPLNRLMLLPFGAGNHGSE